MAARARRARLTGCTIGRAGHAALAPAVHRAKAMCIFRHLAVVCVLGVGSQASAEPTAPGATPVDVPVPSNAPDEGEALPRFALAVNAPTGWLISSFGVSPYVRLGDHVAFRGNYANYQYNGSMYSFLAAFGDGGTGYGGRITDVGIAAIVFPRRAWDGPLLEAGVMHRKRDVYVSPEFVEPAYTRSTVNGGRGLIGWSWLIRERVFIAVAVGVSQGHERGTTKQDTVGGRSTTMTSVDRWTTDGEGYVRIGVAFGG
jgi:hypothetical protein